jgi:hypothetical protein
LLMRRKPTLRRPDILIRRRAPPAVSGAAAQPRARGTPVRVLMDPRASLASRQRGMPKPIVPALALCKASGRSRRKSARSQGVPRAVFMRLAPHPPRWSSVRSGQALTHPDTPPNEALALGRRSSDKRTGLPAVRGLGVRRARRVGTRLGPPGPSSASPLQGNSRPPLPAPRLETLIRHPSVTGRDASRFIVL